jgi:hypothetical protein
MNLKKASLLLISFSMLISCSDETIERDELKLKAIYQDYNLDYNMNSNSLDTEVYFKTSIFGSHVKLGPEDSIKFRIGGDNLSASQATVTKLNFDRKQVYLGSKGVPYYKKSIKLDTSENKEFEWQWYDSETAQTIINKSTIPSADFVSLSHDIHNPLDTTNGDDLKIVLKEKLKKSERLHVTITNVIMGNSTLDLSFSGAEEGATNIFTISSEDLITASAEDQTKRIEKKSKKFGNLKIDVQTEKIIPVLSSGRREYKIGIRVTELESLESTSGKGGTIYKTLRLPDLKTDIIF